MLSLPRTDLPSANAPSSLTRNQVPNSSAFVRACHTRVRGARSTTRFSIRKEGDDRADILGSRDTLERLHVHRGFPSGVRLDEARHVVSMGRNPLGLRFVRRFRLARTVEGDRLANERLEGGLDPEADDYSFGAGHAQVRWARGPTGGLNAELLCVLGVQSL